ncbi:MAG: thioredoxin [Tannerella sp.]|jgi:thioredoxin 1|nr:thioredoxin [Tannerella sp.]
MLRTITDENFNEVLNEGKPLVLDFWAEWCGPCRAIAPIISELASEYDGKVIIGKVNVDENNSLVSQYGIRSIPTVMFFKKDGQIADKLVGVAAKTAFAGKIKELLK